MLIFARYGASTDSSIVDYTYDHGGRRTSRTTGSSVTNYIWDELSAYGDIILEADETDTTIAEYTLANGQLVSQNPKIPLRT